MTKKLADLDLADLMTLHLRQDDGTFIEPKNPTEDSYLRFALQLHASPRLNLSEISDLDLAATRWKFEHVDFEKNGNKYVPGFFKPVRNDVPHFSSELAEIDRATLHFREPFSGKFKPDNGDEWAIIKDAMSKGASESVDVASLLDYNELAESARYSDGEYWKNPQTFAPQFMDVSEEVRTRFKSAPPAQPPAFFSAPKTFKSIERQQESQPDHIPASITPQN